jgi:hypothetical protein
MEFRNLWSALRRCLRCREANPASKGLIQKKAWLSLEELEQRRRILSYPVKRMTRQEYRELPCGDVVDADFLNSCPLRTCFVCKPSDIAPEVIAIGQVVRAEDLICNQFGGGLLSLPKRGINRYLLQVVDDE